jgi:hypothetical protein
VALSTPIGEETDTIVTELALRGHARRLRDDLSEAQTDS